MTPHVSSLSVEALKLDFLALGLSAVDALFSSRLSSNGSGCLHARLHSVQALALAQKF